MRLHKILGPIVYPALHIVNCIGGAKKCVAMQKSDKMFLNFLDPKKEMCEPKTSRDCSVLDALNTQFVCSNFCKTKNNGKKTDKKLSDLVGHRTRKFERVQL